MNLERRFTRAATGPITIEKREGKAPLIAGYGAVFFNAADPGTEYGLWEGYVERVMPGAFDRALREDDVRGLFNHNPSLLLGRTASQTMRLSVDARGLRYEIDAPDTTTGRDVVVNLQRGDLTGSSFGFQVTDEEMRKETVGGKERWIREVRGVKLWDVGPVTYPAYEGTEAEARELRARVEARVLADPAKRLVGARTVVAAQARCVEIREIEARTLA